MQENLQIVKYKEIIHEYLTHEEIKKLLQKSNWAGTCEIIYNWLWILGAFFIVAQYPHFITVFLALFVIGGKQLGCAIIMHDASHFSLFKSRNANILIGNWLGAYPILQNVKQYRPYHLTHHMATGTPEDPDINLTKGYPAIPPSILRKFLRDLTGLTGIKAQFGVLLMHLGILKYNLGNEIIKADSITIKKVFHNAWKNLKGPVAFHILSFMLLWVMGHPRLYALWWIALFTTYNFCLRVRSIAEHSITENSLDPWKNTRTTYANFIEKIFFAPLYVNYHMEHHLLMNAPCYNYPKMHKMLKKRGLYEKGLLQPNYLSIIKLAIK